MPVTNWTVTSIDGKEYLVIDVAKFRIPLDWDPSSNMFIAVAAPSGGLGGFPALVKGDDGETPVIDTSIDFTELDYDDPNPASASWTEISENVYKLTLALHRGPKGDAASFLLEDADNLDGTMTPGYMIVVDSDGSSFTYAPQKCGDMYWPATINNTPSGNASYVLATVSVPPQPVAWRPDPQGWSVITGTGADVQVDLMARLNNSTSGNIVGRGRGPIGVNTAGIATVLVGGPPAGSVSDYNLVEAGDPANIYFTAERQSGSNTFTTTGAASHFAVKVVPVP